MAKKIQESVLPNDSFTFTDGSNFGLDTFDFDTHQHNRGVLDSARLPEAKGLSGLPDGIVTTSSGISEMPAGVEKDDAEGLGNLSSLLREASLTNYDWLTKAVQDYDRLPKNPNEIGDPKTIPALEKAWESSVPDRRRSYTESIPKYKSATPVQKLSDGDIIRKAARQSTFGGNLSQIMKEAFVDCNERPSLELLQGLDRVAKEHGLAGNVFVRESDFPNLHNGAWAAEIKKKASSARYIVKEKTSKLSMYENYLGKKVVASVPWEEAREYYQDRLESSGVRIASKGSISESLRDAFLTEIESKHKATPFQVQKHAADTISAQSAATRLYETRVHSERVNPTDHSFHTKRAKALQVVSSWLSAGLLTTTSVKTVLQDTSNLSGEDIIRNALPNVALTKQAHYMGTGFSTGNTSNYVGIEKRLETFEEAHGAIARQKFERDMKRAAAKVFALETAGVLTHKQANSILSNTALTPEQIIKKAYAAVSSSLPEILEGVTRTYEGTVVTTRQAHLTVKDTDSDQRKITAATEEKALSTIVDLCNRGKMSLKTAKTLLAQNSVIEAAEKALQYATRAKTAAYTNPTANRDTESVFAAHTAAEYDSAEYDLQSEGTLEYEPEAKKQAHLSDIVIDGFYFEE